MCPEDLTSPRGNYVDQLRVHMSKLKRITTREQREPHSYVGIEPIDKV